MADSYALSQEVLARAEELIADYCRTREIAARKFSSGADALLDDVETFAVKCSEHWKDELSCAEQFIGVFQQVSGDAREHNRQTSCDLNYFRLFHIGETGHSLLLARFLNPNAEHGQGRLFLIEFLKMLGVYKPEAGQWVVTAEKGRVDVLLRRRNPHSVVVIENKSNDAVDQPNQLYRYWHQEIFLKASDQFAAAEMHRSDRYKIVYLPSGDWKSPDITSLQKPKQWSDSLPGLLPLDVNEWSFEGEILLWLERCREVVPARNFRLRDYINQYMELWRR